MLSHVLNKLRIYHKIKAHGVKINYGGGWKKGFSDITIGVCGITKNNYKGFLSNKDYIANHPYNGPYTSIIDNKLYLPMFLHRYKEYIPKYYFFIDECGLLPLEDCTIPPPHGSVRIPVSAFFEILGEQKILCLKHTHSSLGKGFMLVTQEGENFFLNKAPIDKGKLEKLILSMYQYIVTEYVVQHPYASAVCSTSLNTLRLLCVWDEEKKEFFLARSFHRFGSNGNIVDNIGSGNGILAFVDVEKGTLTADGVINNNNSGDIYVKDLVHPDRNIKLAGMRIPHFQEIKSKVLEICNNNSFMRYMGFDIAVTKNSFKIIEINSLSSLDVTQQRQGFLNDRRIGKVLKK